MTDYQMPVLSEQDREERIKRFSFEIKRLQSKRDCEQSEDRFFSGGDLWALQAFEIALASLTAKPVAYEVKGLLCSTLDEAEIYVGDPEPLYDAPPVPVKQEGEHRD